MESFFFLLSIPLALAATVSFGFVTGVRSAVGLGAVALVAMFGFMALTRLVYERIVPYRPPLDGEVRAFQMGLLGHVNLLIGCSAALWVALHAWPHGETWVAVGSAMMGLACLGLLVFQSPWSPLYRGPFLVATPQGLRTLAYEVPWADMQLVSAAVGHNLSVLIHTRFPPSHDATLPRARADTLRQVISVTPLGCSREQMVRYLTERIALQRRLPSVSATLADHEPDRPPQP